MQITPRPYQSMAVKAAVPALLGKNGKALVVLATGLGKTITTALIAKEMHSKRILFLVHSNFILNHAIDEFCLVFDSKKIKMAIYNGMSKNGANDADIVFASWQTMGGNLKQWAKKHFDLIIVDEAHHTEADTYRPVINYFRGKKLGITATPDRADKADIRSIFGQEVINITLEEAVARGWLPRIEYHVITDKSLDEEALQKIAIEIKESKRRFTMAEVNRRIFIKKRDHEIAQIINDYNEKAVVFCASIKHADRMMKSLKLASAFHSKKGSSTDDTWKKNQETLTALKNGIIRRVCAVNAFNEGVNVPSVGLVAFCRVTGVQTVFRQQLGRGMRPGKDKLIVLDFVGNLERIQLVMKMMNKISDLHELYTPKEEIEREGYTRQRFEVSGKGFEFTFSDEIVDLMKVLEHCEEELYLTWEEASAAVVKLGIRSADEYQQEKKYRLDPRLPSNPYDKYHDFPGWDMYLGKIKRSYYGTWQEAGIASRKIGIKSKTDYWDNFSKDPMLPSNPYRQYSNFPGFNVFLSTVPQTKVIKPYSTLAQAKKAARKLGAHNRGDYLSKRSSDPRLHSRPDHHYKDFQGWKDFLGTGFYKHCIDASLSAQRLKIRTREEYRVVRLKDPKLYAAPDHVYQDFPGWDMFLGKK